MLFFAPLTAAAVIAQGQGPSSDSGSGSQIIQSRPYAENVQPLQSTPFTNAPSFKENVTFTLGSKCFLYVTH